jgi:hypothetical protein
MVVRERWVVRFESVRPRSAKSAPDLVDLGPA